MSLTTKLFSLLAGGFLIVLATDAVPIDIGVARLVIFLASFYLLVVAARNRQYYSAAFFISLLILFNPLYQYFHFEKLIWRIIDIVALAGIGLFFYKFYDSYSKGSDFEKYVSSLFPVSEWVIEDWTKDKSRGLKRYVESDSYPDLILRNIVSGKRIAVECKFRSRFWTNQFWTGVSWDRYHHDIYKRYGERNNIPVYVAFGVGGNPKNPNKLFLVPISHLEEYKGKIIPAHFLSRFEKSTKPPISV